MGWKKGRAGSFRLCSTGTPIPRHDQHNASHAASENSSRPGGLRAGSPPSPPPHLIRPTVRLLLRSPRLSGPGPHQLPCQLLGCRRQGRYHLGNRLEFTEKLRSVLHQVSHDARIPEELGEVSLDDGQLQMVLPVGLLD